MKVKIVFCLGLILLSFLFSGCWDHTDVDQLSMVVGIGIDKIPGPEPIQLTLQIVNPNSGSASMGGGGGGGNEEPFVVETTKGKTIFEAIHNFAKISPKRILLSHNKVIIMGKNFAESNISDISDYLARDREIRRTNWILVAEGNAKDVLKTKLDLTKEPARGLENMLINSGNLNLTYPVNQNEFFYRFNSIAMTTFAPMIELDNGSSQEAGKKIVIGNKTAVFSKNKMIGLLNDNESKGLLLLNSHIKGETIVIPDPQKNNQKITIDVFKGSTTITPEITNEGVTMKIACKVESGLREAENTTVDLNEAISNNFNKKLEQILKSRIEETIKSAQKKIGVDFIEFSTKIVNNYPYYWKQIGNDWNQIFPNIKYDITVKATIVRSGLTKETEEQSRRKDY